MRRALFVTLYLAFLVDAFLVSFYATKRGMR